MQNGGAKIVVLGHKLWSQRFGSDPNVVNQTVRLNDQSYTVIGVMPALELVPDVLVPIDMRGELRKVGKHSHQVIGRLKPGVTLEQAQAELTHVAQQVEQEFADANRGHGVQLVALHEVSNRQRTASFAHAVWSGRIRAADCVCERCQLAFESRGSAAERDGDQDRARRGSLALDSTDAH